MSNLTTLEKTKERHVYILLLLKIIYLYFNKETILLEKKDSETIQSVYDNLKVDTFIFPSRTEIDAWFEEKSFAKLSIFKRKLKNKFVSNLFVIYLIEVIFYCLTPKGTKIFINGKILGDFKNQKVFETYQEIFSNPIIIEEFFSYWEYVSKEANCTFDDNLKTSDFFKDLNTTKRGFITSADYLEKHRLLASFLFLVYKIVETNALDKSCIVKLNKVLYLYNC